MTPEELREGLGEIKNNDAPNVKLIRDFWYHTGCTRYELGLMDEDELMELWARFVIERIQEVS